MNPYHDEMTKLASDNTGTHKWADRLGMGAGLIGAGSGMAREMLVPEFSAKYRPAAVLLAGTVGGLAGYAGGAMSGTVIDAMRHRVSDKYAADVAPGGADPFKWTRRAAIGGVVLGGVSGLEHGNISAVIHHALMGAATTASLGGAVDWLRS